MIYMLCMVVKKMLFSAVNEIAYPLSAPMINSLLPGAWCPW
jgi:hypothetical protein